MSVSFSCRCDERRKPVDKRRWVVVQRNGNHSAFNGYRWAPSEYSEVFCKGCRALGRTKAAYVRRLKDQNLDSAMRESDRNSKDYDLLRETDDFLLKRKPRCPDQESSRTTSA